ncbi:MAG: CHAT domain-containing protein, partial [Cyanobacteria bacterium J06641_5]
RQARGQYAAGDLEQAEASLRAAADRFETQAEWQPLADTLTNLGRVQYATGRFEPAIATWERAATIHREQINDPATANDLKVLQAEAFKELGLYPRACQTLIQALTMDTAYCSEKAIDKAVLAAMSAPSSESRPMQTAGWRELGKLLRVLGRVEESKIILETQVDRLPPSPARDASEVSLGMTLQTLAERERDRRTPLQFNPLPWQCKAKRAPIPVLEAYDRAIVKFSAAANSNDPLIRTQARLNYQTLIASRGTPVGAVEALATPIDPKALAPGQTRLYATLQTAKNRACLQQLAQQEITWDIFAREIEDTIQAARQLDDRRAESAAWGHLGELYELRAALAATPDPWQEKGQAAAEQAILLAHSAGATDLAYQWEWQLGRFLQARGQKQAAIMTYKTAVESLESVRSDLLTIDADVQFSFRDNVEPLYRELVDLLIPTAEEVTALPQAELQTILASSLYYIESLQLAELENFLQCNLLGDARKSASTQVRTSDLRDRIERIFSADPNATLIYPVLLEDRIATIVRMPDGQFETHSIPAAFAEVSDTIETLHGELRRSYKSIEAIHTNLQAQSMQLYEWLIAPLEGALAVDESFEDSQYQSLIFVLDGPLRNIPMAALYDRSRQRYLLERYAIAQTSGVQLLETRSRSRSRTLVAGLSEARKFEGKSFGALPNVAREVAMVSETASGDTLRNEEFARPQLEAQVTENAYSVVHIATHGNFSSDPNETFLLLSDGLLKARELDRLLQTSPENAIELLVLSACETARGDRHAALGLAGVALRAGALSTLATLWQVNDESTATLMGLFYQQIAEDPNRTKAAALRQAQLQLWESGDRDWKSPFYWAPYTLLGSWL